MDPNQNQGQGQPSAGGGQEPMGGGMPTQAPQPGQPGQSQPTTPAPVAGPEPLSPVPGAPVPGQGDSGQPAQGPEPVNEPQAPSEQGSDTPAQGSEPSSETPGEGSEPPTKDSQQPTANSRQEEAIAQKPKEGEAWDVVIIGSGPAGLTAAVYSTRAALSTLIIGGAKWGGQLMLTGRVDNFPGFPEGILGPDLMQNMRKQAERFGAEFIQADVESVDFGEIGAFRVVGGGKTYQAKSVIIATGAEARWLGLESEKQYIGRGVSSCAPCDAPFFRDKNVIVVGGGDAAMEEALVLTKYVSSVVIVHRRDAFRASKAMQQKILSNPKIKVIWNSEVSEVLGDGSKVTGAKIKNTQDDKEQEMPIDGIFVAIGHTPSTKLFAGQLELDEKGYIKIVQSSKFPGLAKRSGAGKVQNEQGREIGNMFSTMSSVEGVFIAGDVHDFHYRQAVTAAGLGCMAAMDCEKWLEMEKK